MKRQGGEAKNENERKIRTRGRCSGSSRRHDCCKISGDKSCCREREHWKKARKPHYPQKQSVFLSRTTYECRSAVRSTFRPCHIAVLTHPSPLFFQSQICIEGCTHGRLLRTTGNSRQVCTDRPVLPRRQRETPCTAGT